MKMKDRNKINEVRRRGGTDGICQLGSKQIRNPPFSVAVSIQKISIEIDVHESLRDPPFFVLFYRFI